VARVLPTEASLLLEPLRTCGDHDARQAVEKALEMFRAPK